MGSSLAKQRILKTVRRGPISICDAVLLLNNNFTDAKALLDGLVAEGHLVGWQPYPFPFDGLVLYGEVTP